LDIQIWEFLIYDKNTGEIKDRINAHCRSLDYLPYSNRSERLVLKHVDGILDNNLYFSSDINICRSDCYLDPTTPQTFKLKEGTEEKFNFFIKNGYHKTGTTND